MQKPISSAIAASLILCASPAMSANECSAKSGAQTVSLLELYTSEGCSSCPPADAWLSGLRQDSSKFIPLAFHVDYWNYIGWTDRFSKPEYTDRQHKVAATTGASYVYTPQFVLNGRDFRGGSDAHLISILQGRQTQTPRASLQLNAVTEPDGSITLKANAQAADNVDTKNVEVFVALYENKLSSKVNAGENSGRELHHDYVVRELFGAYPLNQHQFSKNFTLKPEWKNRDAGAVLFVQDASNGDILQTLQLKLCAS